MKRDACLTGFCAAVFAVASAHAGDPSEWVQPVLRMGLSFGSSTNACSSGAEWTAGFDLQSTPDSRPDRQSVAHDARSRPSFSDTLPDPQAPPPLLGLRSRCGDVRPLHAFGFDVLDAESVGSR